MSAEQLATRLSARTRLCIIIAGAAAVLAGLLAVGQLGAGAATEEGVIPATCAVPLPPPLGPNQFVAIPYTAVNTPDQAEPGDEVSLTISTDYPEIVATTTNYVDDVTVVYPLPAQVAEIVSVTFGTSEGWEGTVTEQVVDPPNGSFVEVFFEGGEDTSSNPDEPGNVRPTPSITFTVLLDETEDDYYLNWTVPTSQVTHANTIVGDIESACQPDDPDQVINSSTVVGQPTSTTTTSTTTSTTTTTVAPTTTTVIVDPPVVPRMTG